METNVPQYVILSLYILRFDGWRSAHLKVLT